MTPTVERYVRLPRALLILAVVATGCGVDGDERVSARDASVNTTAPVDESAEGGFGPIGGGLAGGSGLEVDLSCPPGVEADSTEWFGPAGLSMNGAVREAFGDRVVGWMGEPELLAEESGWATWGLRLDDGALIAAVTVVRTGRGWDPSHAKFCVIPEPQPAPPPFTLTVSNQSFADPIVEITVTIDGDVIVEESFDVEGQHNWTAFEMDLPAGEHRLHAKSDTGVELDTGFTTEDNKPLWAVLSYWWYPSDGPRHFTFSTHDEQPGFG